MIEARISFKFQNSKLWIVTFNWYGKNNHESIKMLPSEWASHPLSCGTSIPPIIKGYPGSNLWRSNPWPTLKGKVFDALLEAVGPSTCIAVVPAADIESLVLFWIGTANLTCLKMVLLLLWVLVVIGEHEVYMLVAVTIGPFEFSLFSIYRGNSVPFLWCVPAFCAGETVFAVLKWWASMVW